jgi:hypothetical protein
LSVLLPAPQPMSSTLRIGWVTASAARVMSSIASGASIVACCPVSMLEKRSTSASKRRRISSVEDLRSSGVFISY